MAVTNRSVHSIACKKQNSIHNSRQETEWNHNKKGPELLGKIPKDAPSMTNFL